LVSCLKTPPHPSSSEKKFLIVSTTGLGDTLWGTPAIRALRETFPQAPICVLTSPIGNEILRHNPHVDELIVIRDPVFFKLPSLYFQLKKKQFSDVLIFHTSQRPILPLTAVIGAERLIGTKGINKGLDFLLTHPVETKDHEIERRLQLVQQAGAQPTSPTLELFFNHQDEQEAEDFLSQHRLPLGVPLISLHPGAKDLFKQWAPSHFIDLGNRLAQQGNCQIFVTGTPSEEALVTSIASQIKGAIPVTHLKLRAFAAFLKRMKLMISNDTGPMHIAFAMQIPTLALFTPTDPRLCGPYGITNGHVISKQRTCTPCLRKKCREPFCLLQIGVREVYETSLKLLA
jgi:ADP-heptose:LPS heptosyltransferase